MAAPDLSAIVLGYRPGASLDPMARRLHESLATSAHSFGRVLVANFDEGADDDTPAVAEQVAHDLPSTRVVARTMGRALAARPAPSPEAWDELGVAPRPLRDALRSLAS